MRAVVEGINSVGKTEYALALAKKTHYEYIKYPKTQLMSLYLNGEYKDLVSAQLTEIAAFVSDYRLIKEKNINVVQERGYYSLYMYSRDILFEHLVKKYVELPEVMILITTDKYIPKKRRYNNLYLEDEGFQMEVQDRMIKEFESEYNYNTVRNIRVGIRKDIDGQEETLQKKKEKTLK